LSEGWFQSRFALGPRFAAGARTVRSPFGLAAAAFLVGIFCAYATYRQRHVGACDFYGYYQQAILLQAGEVFLPTALDVREFPSIVPLGYAIFDGHAVPQYPPGLPLLLALAGLVGLRTFTLPLLGLVSCVYVYLTCRHLSDRLTAALFTLAWCVFPLVVFGSTTIMSDLAAALFAIMAYYHYRRGQLPISALAMGFGFCTRPANVLILAPFALLLIRDRQLLRYGLWLALPCALYALYNSFVFGLPWRTGYSGVLMFATSGFGKQLHFYAVQTFAQLGPVVLGAALFAFRRPSLEKIALFAWFAILVLAYSFWVSGSDRWWWTRYLLPGYPALFFLGAQGFGEALVLLRERWPEAGGARWGARALTAALAATPVYYVHFALEQDDVYVRNKGSGYYELTQEVAARVPPGSYVGSTEFAGAFHLYHPELTAFVSVHQDAVHLVEHALREGHEAYLVLEPPNRENPNIRRLLKRFDVQKFAELPIIWAQLPVYRLLPKRVVTGG
jgi:hypothetical protein